jgi:hypothetical protein
MFSGVELPMYAAPLERNSAHHWRASSTTATGRVNTWVPYGRVVAREHPGFDRAERMLLDLRQAYVRCQARVTHTNAPISLRVSLPVHELAPALAHVAGLGPIEIGDCWLRLDPTTLRDGDEAGTKVVDGSLSMPWLFGRLDVIAAARPWSTMRADLVLAPANRWRLRYPRRWFTVGFALADEVRRRITLPTG